jgi:hypothetical protein
MTGSWSSDEVERIGSSEELGIAVKRDDGTLRRWVPIWVVAVGGQVYVRTWNRRDTGWFGQAVDSRQARIGVPGLEADIAIEDIGEVDAKLRAGIDAAYRLKYEGYGASSVDRMATDAAAAATLRLIPAEHPEAQEKD